MAKATRPIFLAYERDNRLVDIKNIVFDWYGGMALSQWQKNVESLHREAEKQGISPILEISTKSNNTFGNNLSALYLCLTYNGKKMSVESIFQGSKVFGKNGPFIDMYGQFGTNFKKDLRLRCSGDLTGFYFNNIMWPLEPKTIFYDWIYIKALMENKHLILEILKFKAFTDITFNPKKSFNCQARSVAMFVSLWNSKGEEYLETIVKNPSLFLENLTIYNQELIQDKLF